MEIIDISDHEFESNVLEQSRPVLIDFWAEWCGPCKIVSPALEEIAEELEGRVIFVKMDISENTETPNKYGIRSLPTLILFKNGKIAATKVGAATKSQMKSWLESEL